MIKGVTSTDSRDKKDEAIFVLFGMATQKVYQPVQYMQRNDRKGLFMPLSDVEKSSGPKFR